MAQQYRVQAPDIAGPEPLSPPPLPGDTYAAPARPVDTSKNLANIADALGSFNTNLLQFGTAYAHAQKYQQKLADEAAANQQIGSLSNEDFIKGIESGSLPQNQSPYYQAVIANHYGQLKGYADVGRMQSDMRNGNFQMTGDDPLHPPPDVNAWITQQAQPTMQYLASNPLALKAYTKKLDAFREVATAQQHKALDTQMTQFREGVALDNFNKVFNMDMPPEATQNFLRSVYKETGPGTWTNLSRQQLDAKLMDVLANRASDPRFADKALYVLNTQRQDESGNPIPSLAENPKYAAQVQKIADAASQSIATKLEADTKQLATTNAKSAFDRADGSIWQLSDTTVPYPQQLHNLKQNFTVKAEDAIKQGVTDWLTESKQYAYQHGETPDATFNREWDKFSTNNVSNPEWKHQLDGAATSLTTPSALSNPAQRGQALQTFERFRNMAESNYPYVSTTLGVDKKSLDALNVYKIAVEQMGQTPDRALDVASQAVRTPDNENDLGVRQQRAKDIAQKVANLDWGTSLKNYLPFVNDTAANVSAVQKRVADVASVLTRVPGLSLDDAVKYSIQAVADHSMVVNGHVVPDIGNLSKQQQPYIERLLGDFQKQHGSAEGTQLSDLTVMPAGGGRFQIWSQADGLGHPVFVPDGKGGNVSATITPKMIGDLMAADKGVAAAQTQHANELARDEQLRHTDPSLLTPELQKRQQQLSASDAAQSNAALADTAQGFVGIDGSPSSQGLRVVADGIKSSVQSALSALTELRAKASNAARKYPRAEVPTNY